MNIVGIQNIYFFVLSILIAISASYVALDLSGRVRGITRRAPLIRGSIVMGLGIWSTHFVVMLAFTLSFPVIYHVTVVIISVLVAILASFIALFIVSRETMNILYLFIGGSFMGGAIVAIHYIDMVAMQIHTDIPYYSPLFVLLVLIAFAGSIASLKITFQLRHSVSANVHVLKVVSAMIMGATILGIHYTGMVTTNNLDTSANHVFFPHSFSLNTTLLAVGIGILIFMVQGFVLFSTSVDQKLASQAIKLKKSEQRYRSLVEHNLDPIFSLNLEGRILTINKAAYQITGYKTAQLIDESFQSFLDKGQIKKALYYIKKTKKGRPQNFEIVINHKEGHPVELNITTVPIYVEHEIDGIYGIAKDITDKKRVEEKINYMAFHDELTKLPNRRFFERQLASELEDAKYKNSMVAILFFDLDKFKVINDSLGHAFGDLLLQEVARRYTACIGKHDMVSRMGGDEFTLLMPDIDHPQSAADMAEKILNILKTPVLLNGHEVFISTSIGIALYPQDGRDAETLMKHADIAMYQAKKEGKSNYKFYTATLDHQKMNKVELERDLHKAIERDEFIVHYQPKIDALTRKVIGMEALVRWNHPTLGFIMPGRFIPFAEETGLIVPIGEKVLKMACKQNKEWQDMGYTPMPVAVNVSARQFYGENLVETVTNILKETNLEPQYLELEITEGMAMNNLGHAKTILSKLEALGVKIGVDDFGIGYNSLKYLTTFPIHTLKVDQSFIRDIIENPHNAAIVSSIISLAKHIGLTIVAEGVETEDQAAFLRGQECNQLQGYLFSKPLPADDFEKLLARNVSMGSTP